MIRNYVGATKRVEFDRAFFGAPANTDQFTILSVPSSAWDTWLARFSDIEIEAVIGAVIRTAYYAAAKLGNRVDATVSPQVIYESDDLTVLFTQVLTTDAAALPITQADTV